MWYMFVQLQVPLVVSLLLLVWPGAPNSFLLQGYMARMLRSSRDARSPVRSVRSLLQAGTDRTDGPCRSPSFLIQRQVGPGIPNG